MTKTNGRRLRGERARAEILTRSARIASIDGLEGLSIGRVAAEAGVGKGNIQVLFGDKESLQLATLEKAVELFQATVIFPAMNKKSPLAKLLGLIEGWFDFVEKRTLPGGCFINAVSSEYRARPGRIHDRVVEHRVATRDRYRRLITDAKAAGELRADLDVEQLVFDLVASEAAANVAALMEDNDEFKRARSTSLERIRGRMPQTLPKRKRPRVPRRSPRSRAKDV
ncbi:MAG: TetR/AcrR family transcriptional regulator [Verrucomicrobia bacterium]|nr:TetR/AcrR family transcriptional regulator [Verrucomicrobiota bacterium]